jgi:hypothetical protein
MDLPAAPAKLKKFQERVKDMVIPISCYSQEGIQEFRDKLWAAVKGPVDQRPKAPAPYVEPAVAKRLAKVHPAKVVAPKKAKAKPAAKKAVKAAPAKKAAVKAKPVTKKAKVVAKQPRAKKVSKPAAKKSPVKVVAKKKAAPVKQAASRSKAKKK